MSAVRSGQPGGSGETSPGSILSRRRLAETFRADDAGVREYLMLFEVFERELCKGFDAEAMERNQ